MRQRNRNEEGMTLLLVAFTLFSLMLMAALVVDVGAMVQERRTLQNGADAAALGVAADCAKGACGSYTATAGSYANSNADDGTSSVEEVCGVSPMPACSNPPAVASGVGYVRVTLMTRETDGSNKVPFTFANFVGMSGATMHRQAIAAWGGPSSLTSQLPLTFSLCEFNKYTSNGTVFAGPGPYPPWPTERTIYFHNTTQAPSCAQGPSGADLPGGFGWLQTTTGCQTPSTAGGWVNDSTGRSVPTSCSPAAMKSMIGKVVYIPVYDDTNGLTGSNGQYHIRGFAAFYLTGYSINGQYKENSLISNKPPCGGSDSCISGFFVTGQLTTSTGTIGGPSMGVTVVKMIG